MRVCVCMCVCLSVFLCVSVHSYVCVSTSQRERETFSTAFQFHAPFNRRQFSWIIICFSTGAELLLKSTVFFFSHYPYLLKLSEQEREWHIDTSVSWADPCSVRSQFLHAFYCINKELLKGNMWGAGTPMIVCVFVWLFVCVCGRCKTDWKWRRGLGRGVGWAGLREVIRHWESSLSFMRPS